MGGYDAFAGAVGAVVAGAGDVVVFAVGGDVLAAVRAWADQPVGLLFVAAVGDERGRER